ncbi:hypothetical protein J132_05068 [Termitomyces sp. J132]|nr:hypothetical protein H2248_007110 [Termitomyces sp. 'cryptogamus']KNZ72019.1 hypothetical protein J132_05068 [Termitomyces sp. J132]
MLIDSQHASLTSKFSFPIIFCKRLLQFYKRVIIVLRHIRSILERFCLVLISVPRHFPQGIRLKHRDVPEDHPYKLEPIPTWILLLPQSYFGLSVGSTERFQTLELGPSLSPLNAGILVPKYHTFLEGLVRFMMYQPTGDDVPHARGVLRHSVFFEYLLTYRVEYGENEKLPPLGQMYPAEHQILEELKTEDARWYIEYLFRKRESPSFDEILEFRAKDKITPS